MAAIRPKDPNQSVETYVTKKSLTGNRIPVITPKTINPSRMFLLFNKFHLKFFNLRDSFAKLNSIWGIFYLYASKENNLTLDLDEKFLFDLIEDQKTKRNNYTLHIDSKSFNLLEPTISYSPTPVNRPTTRGGVYFSDKFVFKFSAQVNDLSIVPLLSKSMLGPNTEFKDLKITSQIPSENISQQITLVVNLTNSRQSSTGVDLNLTIIGGTMETLTN